MNDYSIKKAGPGERGAILELLKESFGGYWSATQDSYSPEFWDWLYRYNPCGGSVTFVAEDKGKVVGHFPNVLAYIKVGDEICRAGIVLHLTTRSDYRRKGIFESLGKASAEELARSKIPYSFAFPNDKSRPGFLKKLGFSTIATVPLLVRPLRMRNVLAAITKRPALAAVLYFGPAALYHIFFHHYRLRRKDVSLEIEAREAFGPEFDALWESSGAQATVLVRRDARFLNWRFRERPKQGYKILTASKDGALAGYMVTRKADFFSMRAGIIMDCLVRPGGGHIIEALLQAAFDDFKKEGSDLCMAASSRNNILYGALKDAGFASIPSKLNPRKLVLVGRADHLAGGKEIFLDGRNWFVTFGDWDVL